MMNKDKTYGGKKQQTDEKIIRTAIDGHWINALALYHFLKHSFSNSIVYSYCTFSKKQELADRCGITINKLTVLIRQLKKEGLARKINSGQDLSLTSIYKVKEKIHGGPVRHKCTIHLGDRDTLITVKARLYAKLLEEHGRRQLNTEKSGNHRFKHDDKGESTPTGYRRMAEIFGCSKSHAWDLVQIMKSLGIVQTTNKKHRLQKHGKVNPKLLNHDNVIGYFFVAGGWLFLHLGTIFEYLEYPINKGV